jgi:hypothetical protein
VATNERRTRERVSCVTSGGVEASKYHISYMNIIQRLASKLALTAIAVCVIGLPVNAGSPAKNANAFTQAISYLRGTPCDAARYSKTIDGFEDYLRACGVQEYAARDLTRPNHPEIAARLGYSYFLPPQAWWERGAALALVAQSIQRHLQEPVAVRNWWRPADYNRQPGVDGAANGDHPDAYAFDLDYQSAKSRAKAEQWLRDLDRRAPWLHLSLGLGPLTTHIGIGSPKGHREWHYAGYVPVHVSAKS